MQKVAFFDFCETLVNFQTADIFIDYVRKKNGSLYMLVLNAIFLLSVRLRVMAILERIIPEKSFSKRLKLLQIRNLSYEVLDQIADEFYRNIIKPNLILPVLTEMQKLAKQNYDICLVSAGYSIYLKYFVQDFHVPHLISTEIAFDMPRNRCLGKIAGKDCIRAEKVKRITAHFDGEDINLSESISISDSISDLPMLLLTGKAVVVSKGRSQQWILKNDFREIIWDSYETNT